MRSKNLNSYSRLLNSINQFIYVRWTETISDKLNDKNKVMQKTSDKSSHKSRIIAEDRNFKKYLEETLQVEDLRKKRKQNKISEPEEKVRPE